MCYTLPEPCGGIVTKGARRCANFTILAHTRRGRVGLRIDDGKSRHECSRVGRCRKTVEAGLWWFSSQIDWELLHLSPKSCHGNPRVEQAVLLVVGFVG